jgi:hypothetical protein
MYIYHKISSIGYLSTYLSIFFWTSYWFHLVPPGWSAEIEVPKLDPRFEATVRTPTSPSSQKPALKMNSLFSHPINKASSGDSKLCRDVPMCYVQRSRPHRESHRELLIFPCKSASISSIKTSLHIKNPWGKEPYSFYEQPRKNRVIFDVIYQRFQWRTQSFLM